MHDGLEEYTDTSVKGFAESTIAATIWLLCFPCANGKEPERLKRWLDNHPPGDVLLAIARSRITRKDV